MARKIVFERNRYSNGATYIVGGPQESPWIYLVFGPKPRVSLWLFGRLHIEWLGFGGTR
jgi:hypothetical protein